MYCWNIDIWSISVRWSANDGPDKPADWCFRHVFTAPDSWAYRERGSGSSSGVYVPGKVRRDARHHRYAGILTYGWRIWYCLEKIKLIFAVPNAYGPTTASWGYLCVLNNRLIVKVGFSMPTSCLSCSMWMARPTTCLDVPTCNCRHMLTVDVIRTVAGELIACPHWVWV